MNRTTDAEIRAALKRTILRRHLLSNSARVVDEMGLQHGSGRVDLVVVNALLHGYEIKSDRDKLLRLSGQIQLFSRVFDRITLVVGFTHAAAAMRMVPPWWAVFLTERGPRGAIRFTSLREGNLNPNPCPDAVVRLLWKQEAIELLQVFEQGTPPRYSDSRNAVYGRLIAAVPDYSTLRTAICARLRQRAGWRSVSQLA